MSTAMSVRSRYFSVEAWRLRKDRRSSSAISVFRKRRISSCGQLCRTNCFCHASLKLPVWESAISQSRIKVVSLCALPKTSPNALASSVFSYSSLKPKIPKCSSRTLENRLPRRAMREGSSSISQSSSSSLSLPPSRSHSGLRSFTRQSTGKRSRTSLWSGEARFWKDSSMALYRSLAVSEL